MVASVRCLRQGLSSRQPFEFRQGLSSRQKRNHSVADRVVVSVRRHLVADALCFHESSGLARQNVGIVCPTIPTLLSLSYVRGFQVRVL